MTTIENLGRDLQLVHERLARAQTPGRLGEAPLLAPARRLGRRAERAAYRARQAVARSL